MLATLRVAPRLPSPSLRAAAIASQIGTGKLVHQSNWKADFGQPAVMHFYSGPPMHLRSGVDTRVWQFGIGYAPAAVANLERDVGWHKTVPLPSAWPRRRNGDGGGSR